MLVLIHVIIAVSSLGLAGLAVIFPSEVKIKANYLLTTATLGTGAYLVVCDQSHIASTCITGLIYLCFTSLAIFYSKRRLAWAQINNKEK